MRVVVTGREGQLARSLQMVAERSGVEVVCLGRPALDLADPRSIAPALAAAGGDVVVNAAAYTAVDRAESEPDAAHAVNAVGAGLVAEAAGRAGIPIVQISTDYVFDGTLGRPYREDDPVHPLGVYGRSKREGEIRVAAANPRHVICRTSWVHSPFGQNFVKTMLRLAGEREEIGVVADQQGCPTYAPALAEALLHIARRVAEAAAGSPLFGVFHVTGGGQASWADVAEAVFARSASLGGPTARVKRIATSAYPTPARRPADSRLDGAGLQAAYAIALPDWRASLDDGVACLLGGMPAAPRLAASRP